MEFIFLCMFCHFKISRIIVKKPVLTFYFNCIALASILEICSKDSHEKTF